MRTIIFVASALIALSGCTEQARDKATPEVVLSSDANYTAADIAWLELTNPQIESNDGTSDYFEKFVLQLERQRQDFRETGLEFWHQFPDDPRRYVWLISTVYFAPEYPRDINEWARAERMLGPNVTERDAEAQEFWLETYENLRSDFLSSAAVSDVQKRQLRAAELRDLHRRFDHAYQRDSVIPDEQVTVDLMIDFLRDFPRPLSEEVSEAGNYAFDRDRVLAPALGQASVGYAPGLAARFRDRMQDEGIVWYDAYARITSDNRYRSRIIRESLDAHFGLAQNFQKNGLSNWVDWRSSNPSDESVLFGLYASSGNYPARNISDRVDTVDTATDYADIHISLAYFRELGLIHFDRMPLGAQLNWVIETSARAPFGVHNMVAFMFDPPEDFRTGSKGKVDIDWLIASDAAVTSRMDQLIADDRLDEDAKKLLRRMRADLGSTAAAYLWSIRGDQSLLRQKLEEIRDLDLIHGQSSDAASVIRNYLRPGEQAFEWYGLTETDLAAYLEPFLEDGGPEMRELAENYLSRVTLEAGMNISLQAPTLAGDRTIAVQDFVGDIVLIDNWDTNCAPCIAAFPNLQEILDDYDDQGFAIMSVAYDGASERERIRQIKSRLGLSWETLNGEGLWPAVSARYGLSGFPQYMLIDRQGRYVAGNDEIAGTRNLRSLLDELIGKDGTSYYEQRPAMWRAADEDSVIYLYGTIHNVRPHFNWWTPEAELAAQESDVVYFEIPKNTRPSSDEQARLRQTYLRNPDGVQLSDFLSFEEAGEVRETIEALGLDWDDIQSYSPDALLSEIETLRMIRSGIQPGGGAEARVLEALRDGQDREHRAFASFEQQYRYAADLSREAQVAFLMNSVRADGDGDSFNALFEAWRSGDLEALERLSVTKPAQEMPEVFRAMVTNRNQKWADELSRAMSDDTGTIFVAVGAGHLVGPESVQALMKRDGFEFQRVQ